MKNNELRTECEIVHKKSQTMLLIIVQHCV